MSAFSNMEFDVMDEVYFISSFIQIMENTGIETEQLRDVLTNLLQKGFVQQLIYNESLHDFEKMEVYNETQLESASYVATKKGLLAHNSNG